MGCPNRNSVEPFHTSTGQISWGLPTWSHHDSPKIDDFKQVHLVLKCELFAHAFRTRLEKEKRTRRKEAREWGDQRWGKHAASSAVPSSAQLPWRPWGKARWLLRAVHSVCVLSRRGPGLETRPTADVGKFNGWTLHNRGWGWTAGNELPLQNQAGLRAFLIWEKHFN